MTSKNAKSQAFWQEVTRKNKPGIRRKPILVCACGEKYIATREGQTTCHSCIRFAANKKSP